MRTLDDPQKHQGANKAHPEASYGHPHMLDAQPYARLHWTDEETGATGYLVVHTLVSGLATGGLRMRAGCTLGEVEDLARGMATKTAAFGLPVGGAKGGIDFDPKDDRADEVLERFCSAMRPWLDSHWVTAEDLGVTQQQIDGVFERLGLGQSFHAAIARSQNPDRTQQRVRAGQEAHTEDGLLLSDVIGGYGVAQACLGVINAQGWDAAGSTVAIQGVGTMGGGTAWYLHDAGVPVVALADAIGTLYQPHGLDVPALLELRNEYGEIDRSQVPADVAQLPRDAVLTLESEILVPAAISYAITAENVADISARVVVEAANAATVPAAEDQLTSRGIPVIPDFIANTGAAAWAWWLLFGQVSTDPRDSLQRLRTEMNTKVQHLVRTWNEQGLRPRQAAYEIAAENLSGMAHDPEVPIP